MTRSAASARSLAASAPTEPSCLSSDPAAACDTTIGGAQLVKLLRFGALLALATTVVSGLGQTPVRPGPPAPAGSSAPVQDDEFVGPFQSWTNLRTAYRAAGDG